MPACPQCRNEAPAGSRFCNSCGASLSVPARPQAIAEMESEFQQMASDRPDDAAALYNWALANYYRGRWQEAVEGFRAVLELESDFEEAQQKLLVAERKLAAS